MKLTESNLKVIMNDRKEFCLHLIMPDGSSNYLHNRDNLDVNDIVLVRQLLLNQEILDDELKIILDEGYYRLRLDMHDCNGNKHFFHSRKLNLNDVVFERMQLLVADE